VALLLRNHEVRGLMGVSDYIAAIELGYREFGLGRGVNLPRHNLWLGSSQGEPAAGGHLQPGASGALTYKGGVLPAMRAAGIQAYTWGVGQGIATYLLLFDTQTGELTALMEVLYYDWLKTAAVAAVATRYLAPENSAVAAIFGTGRHARSQLRALCSVRPIQRVQAYSRTAGRQRDFCLEMTRELGVEVFPAASAQAALTEADIITTMTTSPEPVFNGAWLDRNRPLHINAMGAHEPWVREIDEQVVLQSRIVLDVWEQGLKEQGEILLPMSEGGLGRDQIHADLSEIITGRAPGRTSDAPWTLFLSGGTGLEDIAVASHLLERARAKGVGTEIELNQPYQFQL